MSKESEEFLGKMQEFLPMTKYEFSESVKRYGEVLETVIIEDIFMPNILVLLRDNKKEELLQNIFRYFEEVANCDDIYLINIFSVTVLEILGNDKKILEIAKKYMGPKTTQLQKEADRDLGRV